MLAASAVIRVGLGVDAARALVPNGTEEIAVVSPEPASCIAAATLVEALSLREQRLSVREAALEDRLVALAVTEAAVAEQIAALETAEAALSATLTLADGAAEADLTRLTAVYESMKPKDAAPLFEAMAPEFAAGFLGRMRPDAAAAILSGMSSDSAYRVSVLLAGRNARAPTE